MVQGGIDPDEVVDRWTCLSFRRFPRSRELVCPLLLQTLADEKGTVATSQLYDLLGVPADKQPSVRRRMCSNRES